ncbi:MAG TPA: hypothetical protein VFW19_10745 [Allosphingosinicella sp.]|nr:hypothetical protein [Allosphingosinicella sp.]
MLGIVSVIFYIGAICAGAALFLGIVTNSAWTMIASIGAIVSCLFFGAMCGAADRALVLLAKIAGESETSGPLTEEDREERMSRVVPWDGA